MREELLKIDTIRLNFSDENQFVINLAIAMIMFGVALEIKPENFISILKKPKVVIKGLISQFILLPAGTFVLVFIFRDFLTPTVALGMILVAACPGGNVSNFLSSIAGGNVELSISLTTIATIIAIFFTPFNFTFWGSLYASSSELVKPISIPIYETFQTIFIILGIPIIIGIFFSWKLPKLTKKISKYIRIISILVFIGFVVAAFSANFSIFIKYIKIIFIIVLIHNFLAFAIGYFFATIWKSKKRDRRTISIETGIQNSGLALTLIFNPAIFPESVPNGGMAFIAAWWGIWHIVAGFMFVLFRMYKMKRAGSLRKNYAIQFLEKNNKNKKAV